ncbi:amidohydrolase family protein [Paraferrimonas sedimenticola]|uniref:Amidohydrolase n=1 Tax=Paraferrimonas sedimenticola TaxID=375674 RepID=A0AA37RQ93_9GAMM|nr:amidohydrolase family protein [Paraferrimonas sedimenticola]GLP95060.1 amidohydrolase [Paraferrimonas sedimenticola]
MKLSSIALALALGAISSSALAQSMAIENVMIAANGDNAAVENATVVITDGVISAINPASVNAELVVDGRGKILTPGFIAAMNNLGLTEVGMVAATRDDREEKADISFDPSPAFNPKSALQAYARQGGVTSAIVAPSGGKGTFKGLTFAVDLSSEFDGWMVTELGALASVGYHDKGSRVSDIKAIVDLLDNAAKPSDDKEDKEPKAQARLAKALVDGDMPLLVRVDRAADILQLLRLKDDYAQLNLVLVGVAEATKVAQQIAAAKVTVLINPMDNLPGSFDSLTPTLERAAQLHQAGVQMAFVGPSAHNLKRIRYYAGNAVANGLPSEAALAAITSSVAQVFGLQAGRVAVGQKADLALWSADPFEYDSKLESLWINGEAVSLESRQDKLRERYTGASERPRAYRY